MRWLVSRLSFYPQPDPIMVHDRLDKIPHRNRQDLLIAEIRCWQVQIALLYQLQTYVLRRFESQAHYF